MRRRAALLTLLTALLVACGTTSVPPTPTGLAVATPASSAAAVTAAPSATTRPTATATSRPVASPAAAVTVPPSPARTPTSTASPRPTASPASPSPGATGQPAASSASPSARRPEPAGTPDSAALADLYARAARALDQPGLLYHATVQWEQAPAGTPTWRQVNTTEVWIDGHRGVARLKAQNAESSWVSVVTTQGRYIWPTSGAGVTPGPTCAGASLPVAVLYSVSYSWTHSCPAVQVGGTPPGMLEQGQYEGGTALVLVAPEQRSCVKEGCSAFETRRLYLDPATALPVGEETELVRGSSTTRGRATWRSEFIPVDAVPADFFDPASLR